MLINEIEIPECLKLSVEIEKEFGNISNDNIEYLTNLIKKKQLNCNGEIQDLAREFCYDVSIRPGKEELIYKVLKNIVEQDNFPKRQFFEFKSFRSLGGPFLLRRLLMDGIIDLSFIKSSPLFSKFELYFVPEFIKQPGFTIPNYIKDTVDEIYHDDYSHVPSIFLEGWEENSLGYYIKHDDINMFQQCTIQSDFNFNQVIDSSLELSFAHFDGLHTLINISAFFGSIQCFKYLLMNNASVEADLPKLAIMGGSTEIIRICQQKNMKFIYGLYSAMNFRRYDVFDWLVINDLDDIKAYPKKLFFEIRSNLSFLLMFSLGYSMKEPDILYQSIMKSMHPLSVYLISQGSDIADVSLVAALAEGEDSLLGQMCARGAKIPKQYNGKPIEAYKQ